jgi:hypothetical protein
MFMLLSYLCLRSVKCLVYYHLFIIFSKIKLKLLVLFLFQIHGTNRNMRKWFTSILSVRVMVFIATFNNISFVSWRSVLFVEETGVPLYIFFRNEHKRHIYLMNSSRCVHPFCHDRYIDWSIIVQRPASKISDIFRMRTTI